MRSGLTRSSTAPAGGGRRERKRTETRNRLYGSAIQLFLEKGYEATTMDEIAERADTARATAYNHFPRKSLLLAEWMHRRRSEVDQDIDLEGLRNEPVATLLRRYLDDLARINVDQRELTRRLLPAWTRVGGPFEDEPVLANVLTRYIEIGQARGEIRMDCDAHRAGHLIRSAYLGTLYLWLRDDRHSFDLASAFRESIDIILRGLLAAPD